MRRGANVGCGKGMIWRWAVLAGLGAVAARGEVSMSIAMSGADRIAVVIQVSAGVRYELQSTADFLQWNSEGEFVAAGSEERREFALTGEARAFRVREVETAAGAPESLRWIRITNERNATGPLTYTVELTGGREGTFEITSGALGMGTFTYTPSGASARLVMTYQDFPGDKDDLTLEFGAANVYAGTQLTGGVSYPVSGTFAFIAQ